MPRFADPGSLEYAVASQWKMTYESEKHQRNELEQQLRLARHNVVQDMDALKEQHRTELIRQELAHHQQEQLRLVQELRLRQGNPGGNMPLGGGGGGGPMMGGGGPMMGGGGFMEQPGGSGGGMGPGFHGGGEPGADMRNVSVECLVGYWGATSVKLVFGLSLQVYFRCLVCCSMYVACETFWPLL